MSIFKKVFAWIEGLFSKASHTLETVILPVAIAFTNGLKEITDLDHDDIIGKIFGKLGIAAEDKLRTIMPGVIEKLQLAKAFPGLDPNATLASILKLVGTSAPITQTAFWIEFSGLLATDYQDDKLSLGEMTALLKYWYDNHPAEAAPATEAPADTTES